MPCDYNVMLIRRLFPVCCLLLTSINILPASDSFTHFDVMLKRRIKDTGSNTDCQSQNVMTWQQLNLYLIWYLDCLISCLFFIKWIPRGKNGLFSPSYLTYLQVIALLHEHNPTHITVTEREFPIASCCSFLLQHIWLPLNCFPAPPLVSSTALISFD